MKRFLLCLFVLIPMLWSCDNESEIGVWDPIKVNKDFVSIPAEGGEFVFQCKNYNFWWVEGIYVYNGDSELFNINQAQYIYGYEIKDIESDVKQWSNDWATVTYDLSTPTLVKVSLAPNTSTSKYNRGLDLCMSCGDAFTYLKVSQASPAPSAQK